MESTLARRMSSWMWSSCGLSEALELIQRGEIPDGKTALGLLYAAGFKTG